MMNARLFRALLLISMGAGIGLLWPWIVGGHYWPAPSIVFIVIGVSGMLFPRLLAFFWRKLELAGRFMGYSSGFLVFGSLYILIIIPAGLMRRFFLLFSVKSHNAESYYCSAEKPRFDHVARPF